MSVPEGYAVAPAHTDQRIRFAVPIPGRDKPVLVEMPPRKWMTPDEIDKYEAWIKPIGEAEAKVIEWAGQTRYFDAGATEAEDVEKPVRPVEAEALLETFEKKELTLRWVKPYVSAADYKLLMTKIPDGTIEWINKQITDPDITVGESSASDDS